LVAALRREQLLHVVRRPGQRRQLTGEAENRLGRRVARSLVFGERGIE
jgi:hypothetical protein